MNKLKVTTILKCKNLLGESCFWDPRYNCLVWTDIEAKKAWMLDDNNQSFVFNLPDRAGLFFQGKKKGSLLYFPTLLLFLIKIFLHLKKYAKLKQQIIKLELMMQK